MANHQYELVVIGGGPGGYVCAIRSAQLGLKTAIVESRPTLGGTCINVGCIPSKALLDSSHKYAEVKHELDIHGIGVGKVQLSIPKMMERKDKLVRELTGGLDYLMKKNKINVYQAKGSFQKIANQRIHINLSGNPKEKTKTLVAKKCVIATGSQSIDLPNISIDGEHILSSDHAIALKDAPKKLAVIGGGVIGLELGSVWNRLGSEVTIIEAMPSILMGVDKQMRDLALRILTKQGLHFLLAHKVLGASTKNKKVNVQMQDKNGKELLLQADQLLVAVGRKPYTKGLGIDKIGVTINKRGCIVVDPKTLETVASGVYAIGDATEGAMLAHRAEEEGISLAERIAGEIGHVNYGAIPWIVYTWPEIAWVGRSEEELKTDGIPYKVGRALFKPNGRAKAMNETEGQVKIIADAQDDRILGVFIIGPNASELIAEATLAVEFGGSAEDIARSFHAHPTLAEVMREAALDVDKRALHT